LHGIEKYAIIALVHLEVDCVFENYIGDSAARLCHLRNDKTGDSADAVASFSNSMEIKT